MIDIDRERLNIQTATPTNFTNLDVHSFLQIAVICLNGAPFMTK